MTDEYWCEEFGDFIKVLKDSAANSKYDKHGWLYPDTKAARFDHKKNMQSVNRHISQTCVDPYVVDDESGLEHILHAICRLQMEYVRMKRGLKI